MLFSSYCLISFLRGQLINHGTPPRPAATQSNPIAPGSGNSVIISVGEWESISGSREFPQWPPMIPSPDWKNRGELMRLNMDSREEKQTSKTDFNDKKPPRRSPLAHQLLSCGFAQPGLAARYRRTPCPVVTGLFFHLGHREVPHVSRR